MVTLAHRDLNGLAPLDEVFATMTALADESIGAAARESHPELIVAALGKLGGEELNVSSDVDLVFLFDATPRRPNGPLAHAGREVIALALGRHERRPGVSRRHAPAALRRQRPASHRRSRRSKTTSSRMPGRGSATRGSRRAWSRARAKRLPSLVQPFVYRRYLDYGMLEQSARPARAHLRDRGAAAQGRRHQGGQRAASARSSSRCSSCRWCAAGAIRACA